MRKLPELIGVCGRKNSGKDTLGSHLVAQHGFTRYGFADKVKEAVVALDPVLYTLHDSSDWHISDLRMENESAVEVMDRLKNSVPEVRRLMQAMGNEVGQGLFGPTFWIDMVLEEAQVGQSVITDVRYPHEADAIREVGGKVIRIMRPIEGKPDMHASEVQVDFVKYDAIVHNDRDVDSFIAEALEALRAI